MKDEQLRELLRRGDIGEQEAGERAWPVVRGAFGEHAVAPPARRRALLPMAVSVAIAAAVVVLPTPPEPAQMTMRRPSRRAGTVALR